MALANCIRCGALFNKIASDVCLDCLKEEDELLQETKNFIQGNPFVTLSEVLEHIEVEQTMLERWIQEEKIHVTNAEEFLSRPRCLYCGRETQNNEKICRTCMFKQLAKKETNPGGNKADEGNGSLTGMHVKHARN